MSAAVPGPVAEASASVLQVGAIGGVLILALFALVVLYREIRAGAKVDREARERAEARERQSLADMVDKVMPALSNVQLALTAAVEAMREDRRDRR